jgi:redox-sensing transcriptional repressor
VNPGIQIPDRVIERLSAYRRHLRRWQEQGHDRIYSHQLAALEAVTAAQVRRDLMTIGHTGSPARGYEIESLVRHIDGILNPGGEGGIALVGMGHIGGALADYLNGAYPEHRVVAAFDVHPDRVGRVLHGCRCYAVDELERVLAGTRAVVGIIAVPASAAQEVADRLVSSGVRGIVNFAPVRLHVPADVYVDNVDIAVSLEKVAYFAQARANRREAL